jgi:hypothetical protein
VTEFFPKKRQRGVRVEEFQGEVLVYDLDRHTAHCLNGMAVDVWNQADGTTSVSTMASVIARAHGGEPDEALVWRALSELDAASLLDTPVTQALENPSRRLALNTLSWAAAIPLVLSIAVPKPAFAQSGPTAG